tara:strand:- start:46 stop:378 length:333 start_codon:yes stop_codon:yes gene_type:complete
MAKSGTKEWYKEALESSKDEVLALKQEVQALKAFEPAPQEPEEFSIDVSLLSDRNIAALRKFIYTSKRYSHKSSPQVLAAAVAYVVDGSRSSHVAGIMTALKRLKGSGLR